MSIKKCTVMTGFGVLVLGIENNVPECSAMFLTCSYHVGINVPS